MTEVEKGKLELKIVKGKLSVDGSEKLDSLRDDKFYNFTIIVDDGKLKFTHKDFTLDHIRGYLCGIESYGEDYSGRIIIEKS